MHRRGGLRIGPARGDGRLGDLGRADARLEPGVVRHRGRLDLRRLLGVAVAGPLDLGELAGLVRALVAAVVQVVGPDEHAMADLLVVLDALDAHEAEPAQQRHDQAEDQALVVVDLGAPHAPRHREAAGNQHDGVDRPERGAEVVVGVLEDVGVVVAVDRVGAEQPAEHQDFGPEEHPHAELARAELLLGRVEVVGEVRRSVVGTVAVVVGVVGRGERDLRVVVEGAGATGNGVGRHGGGSLADRRLRCATGRRGAPARRGKTWASVRPGSFSASRASPRRSSRRRRRARSRGDRRGRPAPGRRPRG